MAGCAGIGPKTVSRDRFDYIEAISGSWKKQMLLNLVKVRYVDAPVFMEVSAIISQYEIGGNVNLDATFNTRIGNNQIVGGSATYTDRPTITYNPLMGEKFTRSLMTPIPVRAFLALIQSQYPVDFVFRICVHTINGVSNSFGGKLMSMSADPDFPRLIEAMRRIQQAGGLGMRIRSDGSQRSTAIFFREEHPVEIDKDIDTVATILGLDRNARDFRVRYGAYAADDQEIAVITRSMLQIIADLASYIEVPPEDVQQGRVAAGLAGKKVAGMPPLIRVHNDNAFPEDAFVAVRYRDSWFYIDDTDLKSKRMFSFLMMLFSLTETGPQAGAPLVTVPTN
jgi:hypothetical protein